MAHSAIIPRIGWPEAPILKETDGARQTARLSLDSHDSRVMVSSPYEPSRALAKNCGHHSKTPRYQCSLLA